MEGSSGGSYGGSYGGINRSFYGVILWGILWGHPLGDPLGDTPGSGWILWGRSDGAILRHNNRHRVFLFSSRNHLGSPHILWCPLDGMRRCSLRETARDGACFGRPRRSFGGIFCRFMILHRTFYVCYYVCYLFRVAVSNHQKA